MSFKKDEMLIMPAVDIKNGKCVQLVQGEPGSEMVEIENPELVAKHWEDLGAKNIHVIDLDGTINGVASFDIIKKILNEVSVPIQLGGGIRSVEYAKELLDLDIERIIIGTMGIKQPETIEQLSDEYGSDRIMISLDSKDNRVVIKGWQEKIDKSPVELSAEFKEHGAGSILFTNVDVEFNENRTKEEMVEILSAGLAKDIKVYIGDENVNEELSLCEECIKKVKEY